MNFCYLLFIFSLFSCSHLNPITPKEANKTYSYIDVSGHYLLNRESKSIKNKLVTRIKLTPKNSHKSVEKSVTLSQVGSVRNKSLRILTLRPFASEFEVWLEGKRYSTKMNIDVKSKSMKIETDGLPKEHKWYGNNFVKFPNSQFFCYFNQLPDCLYQLGFLQSSYKNSDNKIDLYVVWDSFPFIQDQLSGVGRNLFSKANLRFDREEKNNLLYELEVDGQIILYYFSKSFDLVKIIWIAQGISVLPPGEELNQDD